MPRKKTSKEIESEILTKSGRRCCLCYGLNGDFEVKRGQIAHINRDSSNSDFENLAFLCLEHHDVYDSRTSQSKGIRESELKLYRDTLYVDVEKQLPRLESKISDFKKDQKDQIEDFHSFIESLRSSEKIRSGILNDYEIHKSIESGFIEIDPFDESQLRLSSYNFSLGQKALIKDGVIDITSDESLFLKGGSFALVETKEFISMPNGLIGRIYPLASLSKKCIFVHTGHLIEAGFKGRLFVGVQNASAINMKIPIGSIILSMEFSLLNIAPKSYRGQRHLSHFGIYKKRTID